MSDKPTTPATEEVWAALRGVIDPELGDNIVDLGMVASVEATPEGTVIIGLALTIAECPLRDQIEGDTRRRALSLPGVDEVVVHTTAMTKRQRAELMSRAREKARDRAEPTQVSPTTRVIAVSSGKGGVGKSSVSVNLAIAIKNLGFRVGLMDADIWGFSVPRLLGINTRMEADDVTRLIIPVEAHGLKVVSTGLIIDSEETALMWRGLMLAKALEQFLKQVDWGELDYLVIDMPPGTGDIQMALSRMLPQAEMVVVTTPQRASQKVAARIADMARRSHMPIVGVIENMSGFDCGHGAVHHLFGRGGGQELAEGIGVPLLAQVPLDIRVVEGGDRGCPVAAQTRLDGAALAFAETAELLVQLVPPAQDETCTGRLAKLLEGLAQSGQDWDSLATLAP
ncbi:MAG: Mrp/NBP35 family ATP-binding protein [Acidimicrobiia bacterium]|nr:Mrp/NBP35 family ATP-binding protein [Acidimicrobiia bacterium]MXX44727.1 Mrp/NBP35 family ATP-binding protein [Acidimicrobiia bacterium]MXY75347.1 Mrp/NBP35 family ATP-binding protein [Acidimicrobiia bacterium]MYA39073.1 Mrp/NBP35 family ATP-binding protein [Acidimicrobiia bacterium]MYB78106.1 Mrp/NBP35 family ATP-binding protein [Acidimicrobiia bacterium]